MWSLTTSPNPFNPLAKISYQIPKGGVNRKVSVRIYNPNGSLIKTLINDIALPGRYHTFWYGNNAQNRKVASGMYLVNLQCSGDEVKVLNQKIMLLK
jgi:flagellar hook assembly protein FlgD